MRRILAEAGATISARDEGYRSTPLAWAAGKNLPDMVAFLLSRGARCAGEPAGRRAVGDAARVGDAS